MIAACSALCYDLVAIHEVVLYSSQAPIFQKYFNLLAREKILAENIPARCLRADGSRDEEALDIYCKEINDVIAPLEVKPALLKPNVQRRSAVKTMMNSCLG